PGGAALRRSGPRHRLRYAGAGGPARGPCLGEQAGGLPSGPGPAPTGTLGAFCRRMRPHRPQRQGPRRGRPLAAAGAAAGRHRRTPGAPPAGLVKPLLAFGGTFDPIHAGHLAVARAVRDAFGAEGRLLPAADPPHRPPPDAGAAARAGMVALAIAGEPGLVLDRRELERPGPSWTVDSLAGLRAERGPLAPLAWVLGADAFRGLPAWHQWT